MDSNFRYTGMRWLQGSNTSLTEIGICPQKQVPCIVEQICRLLDFLDYQVCLLAQHLLWNYGIAAQFSGKREGPAGPLTLLF